MLKCNTDCGQDTGEGIEHVCFAPLYSTFSGAMTPEKCTVQSLWGYFQDDVEIFDETDTDEDGNEINYLNRIKDCTQSVYFILCFDDELVSSPFLEFVHRVLRVFSIE